MPTGFRPNDLFKLYKSIAPMARHDENREDDIVKLETLLERTGDMDLRPTDGPTGFYGERLMESIQQFQKRNALKVDGAVRPNGETIRTLAAQLDAAPKPKRQRHPVQGAARDAVLRRLRDRGVTFQPGERELTENELKQLLELIEEGDALLPTEGPFEGIQQFLDWLSPPKPPIADTPWPGGILGKHSGRAKRRVG